MPNLWQLFKKDRHISCPSKAGSVALEAGCSYPQTAHKANEARRGWVANGHTTPWKNVCLSLSLVLALPTTPAHLLKMCVSEGCGVSSERKGAQTTLTQKRKFVGLEKGALDREEKVLPSGMAWPQASPQCWESFPCTPVLILVFCTSLCILDFFFLHQIDFSPSTGEHSYWQSMPYPNDTQLRKKGNFPTT